jgi:SecD/SecF fusion protein
MMKTIVYSLIAILILSAVSAGFPDKTNPKDSIRIQSVDRNISSVLLTQCADVISGRLKDYGTDKFNITVIPEVNQIQVVFTDTCQDLKAAENLLVQKGAFAFYETYDRESLIELLKGDNHLFSMLNSDDTQNLHPWIGCISAAGVAKVNDYTASLGLDHKCKFVWSQGFDNSRECLYALRLNNERGFLLSGTDIESMKYFQEQASESYCIEIKFRKESVQIWSDATRRNVNKTIALVLDDRVIFSPRVNEAIDSGNCIISGSFTEDQVRYIAALGNNGELPANFEVVK